MVKEPTIFPAIEDYGEALYSIPGLNTIAPFGSVRWGEYDVYTVKSLLGKTDGIFRPSYYIYVNYSGAIQLSGDYNICLSSLVSKFNTEEREQFYKNMPEIMGMLGI